MNLFEHTERVSIELSNLCNYASIHKKCPANLKSKNPTIIPGRFVYEIVDTMCKYGFKHSVDRGRVSKGRIAFHNYNEPLIDPRLFMFISYIYNKLPETNTTVWSNGYYLTQSLLDELAEVGLSQVNVSAYSDEEYSRISKYKSSVIFNVYRVKNLDERLYWDKIRIFNAPCYAPLRVIEVSSDGRIFICCHDWERLHTFGNLNNNTFEEIVGKGDMLKIYNELIRKVRKLNLCRRCFRKR